MNITTEPLEHRQVRLTIEVDDERTQQAMKRAARQIAGEVSISGFRKGKAPYEVIIQRFGEDTVRREAADLLADDVYGEALDEKGIDPYAPGELSDVKLRPITFTLTVPLRPVVELGDYRSVRLEPNQVSISDEQVAEALENIRADQAMFESVERPAGFGDGAVLNLVAHAADGAEVLKGDDIRTILEAGSIDPTAGFAEAVVGMSAGEERSFTLALGDNFPREKYRGQDAEFKVKVTDVYKQILPGLDDDLARALGSFESLKELEERVRGSLQQEAQARADQEHADKVVDAVVGQAQVDFPPAMQKEELDVLVKDMEQSLKRDTRLSMEDYLRIQGKTIEQVREELIPRAEERLKRGLVLSEVVAREKLELDEEEVNTRIQAVSSPWGGRAEQVRASLESDQGRRTIRGRMLIEKAVARLVAVAKGEAPEVAPAGDQPQGQAAVLPEAAAVADATAVAGESRPEIQASAETETAGEGI